MTEIEQLNSRIGAEYMSIDGRALFRLIWSENAFENRRGTFREFSDSGLFIREVTEVRRVRKYNYIHNRWIFEAWAPGNLTANVETPDTVNGDSVPVYVFEDRHGGYLPPNEKVVRFLIAAVYGKVRRDEIPSQEYLEEKEIQRVEDSLDDHPAWFQTRPGATRNAIWLPEYRRATFSENLNPSRKTTAREKAEVFREELQEIEDLEKRKANLKDDLIKETEVFRAAQHRINEETSGSPMHRGKE